MKTCYENFNFSSYLTIAGEQCESYPEKKSKALNIFTDALEKQIIKVANEEINKIPIRIFDNIFVVDISPNKYVFNYQGELKSSFPWCEKFTPISPSGYRKNYIFELSRDSHAKLFDCHFNELGSNIKAYKTYTNGLLIVLDDNGFLLIQEKDGMYNIEKFEHIDAAAYSALIATTNDKYKHYISISGKLMPDKFLEIITDINNVEKPLTNGNLLYPVKLENGLWSFIKVNGSYLNNEQYLEVNTFCYDRALVRKTCDMCALIDCYGNEITTFTDMTSTHFHMVKYGIFEIPMAEVSNDKRQRYLIDIFGRSYKTLKH